MFWLRWGPALLVMTLIFAFSSIPSQEMPNFGHYDLSVKKGGHMLGYAILCQTYLWGLGRTRPRARLWAWSLAVLYAVTDEVHQSFVPGRGPWTIDVGIDAIGALLGLLPTYLPSYQRLWGSLLPKL